MRFLKEDDFGLWSEVLAPKDHLQSTQNRTVVHVLSLYHWMLMGRPLSCKTTQGIHAFNIENMIFDHFEKHA